jgi:nitroreductase
LEAARLAPTAANRQAFRVIVIETKGREDELRQIYSRDWFTDAPLVLAVCGIPGENWVRVDGHNYVDVDTAIVMDHMVLQATDLGLGTCWIGAFDPDATRRVLRLPAEAQPVALTPLGYPADKPGTRKRKSRSEILCKEYWGG